MAPAAISTLLVEGRHVGWHRFGDPAGRPILFVHGWGMVLSGYRHALEALASSGWAVHACDLPGFGRSEPLALRQSSLTGYARFLALAHQRGPLLGEPVPVAKTADLTAELTTLHRHAVPAHLVLADHDSIVPAGRLGTAPSASTRVVAGNHGWMLRNLEDFAAPADRLIAVA